MNKYPVVKIQFEHQAIKSIISVGTYEYSTKILTRVQYLLRDNTLFMEWFEDGKLKIILDQDEKELPYITGNEELHLHPKHLENIETIAIKYD